MTTAEEIYDELKNDWKWLRDQRASQDSVITPTEVLSFKWSAVVPALFHEIGIEPTKEMQWNLRQCLVNDLSFRDFLLVLNQKMIA